MMHTSNTLLVRHRTILSQPAARYSTRLLPETACTLFACGSSDNWKVEASKTLMMSNGCEPRGKGICDASPGF